MFSYNLLIYIVRGYLYYLKISDFESQIDRLGSHFIVSDFYEFLALLQYIAIVYF